MLLRIPRLTFFPYTTLFRSAVIVGLAVGLIGAVGASQVLRSFLYGLSPLDPIAYGGVVVLLGAAAITASYLPARRADRKSTRLNSSHLGISYAVFCLKKNKF